MNERNIPGSEPETIRINKYLSDIGFCSRREADRLIEQGKVTVNGIPAVAGERVLPGANVCVNGKPVKVEEEEILLVVNKPLGIVCTTASFDKDNIVDFLNYPKRIYPIGRLDKDSTGLILMTNRGELVNKILRGGNYHEKEYLVRITTPVTEDFIAHMRAGVVLDDGVKTKPCKVEKTGGYTFKIILTQGLNRQIRRMCEALGCRVSHLKRVRIMNIELGDLKAGAYRPVTPAENRELMRLLSDSTDRPYVEAHKELPEDLKPVAKTEEKSVERKTYNRSIQNGPVSVTRKNDVIKRVAPKNDAPEKGKKVIINRGGKREVGGMDRKDRGMEERKIYQKKDSKENR